jgi:6-phosphofructokinase 2
MRIEAAGIAERQIPLLSHVAVEPCGNRWRSSTMAAFSVGRTTQRNMCGSVAHRERAAATEAWRAAPLVIEPVTTVGAGDSFLGAMVWALASRMTLVESFRIAVAGGSAALLEPGTALCQPQMVRRLQAEVFIEAIFDEGR